MSSAAAREMNGLTRVERERAPGAEVRRLCPQVIQSAGLVSRFPQLSGTMHSGVATQPLLQPVFCSLNEHLPQEEKLLALCCPYFRPGLEFHLFSDFKLFRHMHLSESDLRKKEARRLGALK